MKFRKKPVVIDAFPIESSDFQKIKEWVESFGDTFSHHFSLRSDIFGVDQLFVKTLEGTSYGVTPQDVILRGIKGEYYPCKVDIFEATYEPVNE